MWSLCNQNGTQWRLHFYSSFLQDYYSSTSLFCSCGFTNLLPYYEIAVFQAYNLRMAAHSNAPSGLFETKMVPSGNYAFLAMFTGLA